MSDRYELMEELSKDAGKVNTKPAATRGHLHFLIGLPRSGKSSWAKQWVLTHRGVGMNPRVIVCADQIRLAISGQRFNGKIEPVVHMVKDYMIESLLASGHDVLVDGTHTQLFSIKRNFQIDPDASSTFVDTPADVCKQRAKATGQEDLYGPIDRMARQLEKLRDEGVPQVCKRLQEEARRERENRGRIANA